MLFQDQIPLREGWLFSKGTCEGAERADYDDRSFIPVTLPHDWQISEKRDPDMEMGWSQGYYPRSETAWYRLRFSAPTDWRDKAVRLKLDGCQRFYDIYLNGTRVGGHRYGYVPTLTALDPQLRYGESNVLAIRVNREKNLGDRWYSGAGLCRMASLLVDEKVHIAPWSVFARYDMDGDAVHGQIDVECVNAADTDSDGVLALSLKDAAGTPVWQARRDARLKPGIRHLTVAFDVARVLRWDVGSPHLYRLEVSLQSAYGTDRVSETLGFRSFAFDGDTGFTLNGRKMKMYGANLHHDGGVCFGAAVPRAVLRRRLNALKRMGCNAIRCSHNPHDEAMYELCDELGLLVIDEVYDKWCKSDLYFGELFEEDWRDDLKAMVLRDRNHPSVILWSLGNEIEVQFSDYFYDQLKIMIAACKALDPTRPVTEVLIGFCGGEYSDATPLEKKVGAVLRYSEIVDVFCGNYMENYYSAFRKAGMRKAIIGTEVFSYYRHEELTATGVAAVSPWKDVDERPYVCGGFVWAGVDYLGESTGWPCKGWTGCPIDSTGTWKLRAWHLASQWRKDPVLKLGVMDGEPVPWDGASSMWGFPNVTGHWNYPPQDRIIHVVAMTNCDEVRLYQNNDFVRTGHSGAPDRMIHMYVRYRRGTLRAEGWKNGQKVIETVLRTSDKPEQLALIPDPAADGGLIQVDCWVLDAYRQPWVNTSPEIRIRVEGNGRLIGLDHGDFMRQTDPRSPRCAVKDGHLTAYIQRTGSGTIRIYAEGPDHLRAELDCD